MSMWLIGAVVALVYPTFAGIVWRLMGAPQGCNGAGVKTGYNLLSCEGFDALGKEFQCEKCWKAGWAKRLAWLWPLYPLYAVPRRLFLAGANVTARPMVDTGAEREKVAP